MKIKYEPKFKTSQAKALPVILLVIGIIFAVVYFKTDLVNQFFGGYQNQQVTYYQWTDERGEMVVSRNKPTTTNDYITFQSSEDLMKNENIVDQDLIDRSNNSQTSTSQQNSKKEKSENTVSKMYPFGAMDKAKNCVNLSSQLADAKNRGQDTTELKKQYAKECG